MKILEQRCIGKKNDPTLNEDALIITDHCVAVIDGATSAGGAWGKPGGLVARELLAAFLSANAPLTDGFSYIRKMNDVLFQAQQTRPDLFARPECRMMASVLVFSVARREIWSYGDCRFSVNAKQYCFDKKIDEVNASVRSFVNTYYLAGGSAQAELLQNDPGAQAIRPFLEMQPRFANREGEFGYPILDGGPLCEAMFLRCAVSSGDEVILATDGYPFLENTLSRSEERLALLKKEDPLCIRSYPAVKGFYPSFQGFDDRTYVRLIV